MTGASVLRIRSQSTAIAESPTWGAEHVPRISIVVPTHERAGFLVEFLTRLEQQALPRDEYEAIVVDDGSTDGSWEILRATARQTSLRLVALRHEENMGPGAARNSGVATSRAEIVAFIDDDCLPTPQWLLELLRVFEETGATVVQGRVEPPPTEFATATPWDHAIWVQHPSPFFETANVAYTRASLFAVGGFDDRDPLLTPEHGRGFGEDAELAARVLASGGTRTFAQEAVVHHRVARRSFREHLARQHHVSGFPGLARRSAVFAAWLRGGVFLSRHTMAVDAGIVGAILAAAAGNPLPLTLLAPWLRRRLRDARYWASRGGGSVVGLAWRYAVVDLVTFGSLLEGTIRHRRLVL